MAQKITNQELLDLLHPHQAALLKIAQEYRLPLVIGMDTSSITGCSTAVTTMYAAGPVGARVCVAMDALREETPLELVDVAALFLSYGTSDFDAIATAQKAGRA